MTRGRTREAASGAYDFRTYETAFAPIDGDPAQVLVAATDGIDVVATMQLSFIPGLTRRGALRAQAEAVRVAASHRSLGLGAAMFEWVIERGAPPWVLNSPAHHGQDSRRCTPFL